MPNLIEIKARCHNSEQIKQKLKELNADYKGLDHQIDTYYKVAKGRLKLRNGTIESNLIHYIRPNQTGPKNSVVHLYRPHDVNALSNLLTAANDVLVVVDKQRHIYFIDNVKFHVDEVLGLGTFVEIEAIDMDDSIPQEKLQQQCEHYMKVLEISDTDLVKCSYSDLLLE